MAGNTDTERYLTTMAQLENISSWINGKLCLQSRLWRKINLLIYFFLQTKVSAVIVAHLRCQWWCRIYTSRTWTKNPVAWERHTEECWLFSWVDDGGPRKDWTCQPLLEWLRAAWKANLPGTWWQSALSVFLGAIFFSFLTAARQTIFKDNTTHVGKS